MWSWESLSGRYEPSGKDRLIGGGWRGLGRELRQIARHRVRSVPSKGSTATYSVQGVIRAQAFDRILATIILSDSVTIKAYKRQCPMAYESYKSHICYAHRYQLVPKCQCHYSSPTSDPSGSDLAVCSSTQVLISL